MTTTPDENPTELDSEPTSPEEVPTGEVAAEETPVESEAEHDAALEQAEEGTAQQPEGAPALPDSIPALIDQQIDPLTLLSLIREGVGSIVTATLNRDDVKANLLFSVVGGNGHITFVVTNRKGERRFIHQIPVTQDLLDCFILLKKQYNEGKKEDKELHKLPVKKRRKARHHDEEPKKGTWLSISFTVDPDGFITKTDLNFDKPVFINLDPEKWHVAPETDDYRPLWTKEQYLKELEMSPRDEEFIPDWFPVAD